MGILDTVFGNQADPAQNAAMEQQTAAKNWLSDIKGKETEATGLLMTPAQMQAHGQALSVQEQNVARQEAVVQAMEPALLSAGKQMNDLLQGKSAPVMQNLNNQRQLQREQLVNQLNQSMGPGGSASAAGQQQLAKFDSQTNNLQTQTQQSYMQQIANIPLDGGNLGNSINAATTSLNNLGQNSPEAQKAQMIQSFASAENPAQQAVVGTAGADQVAAQIRAQQQGQLVAGGLKLGGAALGAMAGGPSGAQKGAQAGGDLGAPGQSQTGASNDQYMGSSTDLSSSLGAWKAKGGVIPGTPNYPGENRIENDTVHLRATPGEGIIPLSHMTSPSKAKKFVDKMFSQNVKGKANYDKGGITQQPPGAAEGIYNNVLGALGMEGLQTANAAPKGSGQRNYGAATIQGAKKNLGQTFGGGN